MGLRARTWCCLACFTSWGFFGGIVLWPFLGFAAAFASARVLVAFAFSPFVLPWTMVVVRSQHWCRAKTLQRDHPYVTHRFPPLVCSSCGHHHRPQRTHLFHCVGKACRPSSPTLCAFSIFPAFLGSVFVPSPLPFTPFSQLCFFLDSGPTMTWWLPLARSPLSAKDPQDTAQSVGTLSPSLGRLASLVATSFLNWVRANRSPTIRPLGLIRPLPFDRQNRNPSRHSLPRWRWGKALEIDGWPWANRSHGTGRK